MPKAGEKRTEAQKQADKRYNEKVKEYKRETFATVGAMLKKEEAESIRTIYTAHGIKTADVLRASARYILQGGTIAAGQEPITADRAETETEKE